MRSSFAMVEFSRTGPPILSCRGREKGGVNETVNETDRLDKSCDGEKDVTLGQGVMVDLGGL